MEMGLFPRPSQLLYPKGFRMEVPASGSKQSFAHYRHGTAHSFLVVRRRIIGTKETGRTLCRVVRPVSFLRHR